MYTTKFDGKKIFVTGASGWVGRTFLHELQSLIPPLEFNEIVVAFGSKHTQIVSTNYLPHEQIVIPIYPLTSLYDHSNTDNIFFIHCAFLTKDRLNHYGINSFIDINESITSTVSHFLDKCSDSKVVVISSGAATNFDQQNEFLQTKESDIYGLLKLREERIISAVANTQVLRVYALTGRFIRDPHVFAIGDLLIKALRNEPLIIKSTCPVIRSYASASDIVKCAISWLRSSDLSFNPICVSSQVVALTDLGSLIAKTFNLPPPIFNMDTIIPNSYITSSNDFTRMLKRYGLNSLSLSDQIIDTANGLKIYHL